MNHRKDHVQKVSSQGHKTPLLIKPEVISDKPPHSDVMKQNVRSDDCSARKSNDKI
jgi:hypothetical protein